MKTTAQELFVKARIEQGKEEIIADAMNGRFEPSEINEFGDLHDHVDANEYAGLCDDTVVANGNELFPERTDDTIKSQGFMDVCEEIQNALNQWIVEGGLRRIANGGGPCPN